MASEKKWNWQESNYEKFKDITARVVLEWMEEASRFLGEFWTKEDVERFRKIKEERLNNARRT